MACGDYIDAVDALAPIAHLRCNEVSGSAALADHTGNGHTTTLDSYALVRVPVGGPNCGCDPAANFGGHRVVMSINRSTFGPGSDYTVVLWVKLGNPVINRLMGSMAPYTQQCYAILLTIYGVPYFYSGHAADINALHGTQTIDDGEWHMVAYSREDGSPATQRLWIDGVLDASRSEYAAPASTTATTWGVGQQEGSSPVGDGDFDEISVFDYVLSNAEIAALWAAGAPVSPCPPTAGWHVGRVVF